MPDYEEFEVIEDFIQKALENVHTSLICRVEKVNSTTIDVQPVTKKVLNGCVIDMPLMKDVPPIFMYGGTSYDAMPITQGDYCIVFVTEECTDRWYGGEDDLEPNENRKFDYSDCFALCGVLPKSKAIDIPQVATSIGDRHIEGNWTHLGNIILTGNLTMTGTFILNGVNVNDFISSHTHPAGTPPGNTGAPN